MKRPCLLILLIFAYASAYSVVIRVPQDLTSIQEAIDVASPGDTILVNEGTYVENLVIPKKNLTIGSLYLTTGDTSHISKTIIDGNRNGSVVSFGPMEDDYPDNVFTGFTIRNGSIDQGLGGGIFISGVSPVLSYLRIMNNSANQGGGIACFGSPGLNLNHSTLSQNQSINKGAAIRVANAGLNISHCLISGNQLSGGKGGALSFSLGPVMSQAPEVKMNDVQIVNNSGLGIAATAGAYFENPGAVPGLNIIIENCLFQENKCIGNTALDFHGQDVNGRLVNCSFIANEAVQYGAGAVFTAGSKADVINCLFISNVAATGGGNYNSGAATVWGSDVNFFNCNFVENSAAYGSALTVGGGKAVLENCILWENANNSVTLSDAGQHGSEFFISYSDIQNGQSAVNVSSMSILHWGDGNMDTNPLFADEGDYAYMLDADSPCIDAGNPDSESLSNVLQDFLGNNRIWDGDGDESAVVDMGPYEFGSELISGMDNLRYLHDSEIEVRVYPNPFSTSTILEYKLIQPREVILSLYDASGRLVRKIEQHQSNGLQKILFNPAGLCTGIYYFILEAGDRIFSGNMTLTE